MATNPSDISLLPLLKDLNQTVGHSVEWLREKGFSAADIERLLKEEQEQKEKVEAELRQREAKQAADREVQAKAEFEAKVRREIEEKYREEYEAKFKELEAKRQADARSQAAETKSRSETAAAPGSAVGWLKNAPPVFSRYFGGTSDTPPISPGVPAALMRLKSGGDRKQQMSHKNSETAMRYLIEKTLFQDQCNELVEICRQFADDHLSEFKSLDELFSQSQIDKLFLQLQSNFESMNKLFEQGQYDSYHYTIAELENFLNRDRIIYNFNEQEKNSILYKKALEDMLRLVKFFTAEKIDRVIAALYTSLKAASNQNSMAGSPSASPVLLSLSGSSTGAPVSPMPPLSSAASAAAGDFKGRIEVGAESDSPRFDDAVIIDESLRRLLEVIIEKKFTCPEPDKIQPILDAMTSKRPRRRV